MHWLRAHLAAAGKTPDGLAAALRAMDATAVAELCDDQFEEHILAYPPHRSGLYLHGINRNTPQFVTYPFARVCAFAREWGFRQTPCLEKHDVPALRSLLADAATTGSWAGTPTEGFVVRCQARDDLTADDQWYDYFFKYKFDEPYLMYRQWRELTKDIIANRVLRNMHKKNAITRSYVRWARKTLAASPPDVASQYLRNHGIIALREEFLKQYAPKPTDSDSSVATEITTDTPLVLVPVATVGCGKTSVALALARLFGWAHVQNDDNTRRKGAAKHFASLISEQLDTTNIYDISRHKPDARFIALHWVHDNSAIKKIYKTTLHRVLARGDNHQSIQASDGIKQVLGIMDGFLHSFQPCNDDQSPDDNFDFVIDLHPLKSSRENLETVITTLRQHFPAIVPEIPPPQDLDDAIKFALEEYHPQIRKNVRDKLLYFAGVLDHNMVDILESIYAKHPESNREFFDFLRANQGFKAEFHVTLAHLCDKATHPQIWQHYKKLLSSEITTEIELQLQEIVWNDRIMCVPVTLVQKDDDRVECTHEYPHITIGLANDTVKPVEALQMLQKRATGELDDIHSITIHQDIKLNAHVRGITYKKGPQA
ncbi:tRNA ligase 1 [Neolecta irregularis DAH-3]|uniref:tRNA ligase 1 n=1 Tax=Neolecta irregularis (strain DAH-3) TaxID=1198029 RepID=A0A1U7LKN8_NEOID|nr:tRNA ligase 1 [Neolecta irregularis DAH-3]|eukprot:OLL23209.1 tRNA ligase 1 [Neolecta irregularis DAH-3]